MRLSSVLVLALLVAPTLTYADTVLVGTNLSAATHGGAAVVCPSLADCQDYANQFTLSTAVVIDSISVVVSAPGDASFSSNGNFTIGLGSPIGTAVTTGIGAGNIPDGPNGTLNTEEFTFSGLNLSLAAGTYYLGMAGANVQWDYAPPLSTPLGALGQRFACDPSIAPMHCASTGFWQALSAPNEFAFEIDGTTATPEPSTFALLGTGLLGLAGVARRKFLSRL
jgi:PEP-CTERM motif